MRLSPCNTALLLLALAACGGEERVKDLDGSIEIEGALPDPERQGGLLVDFGAVVAGGSAGSELILRNRSGGAVRLEPVELAPPFASGAAAGVDLPPRGSAAIALTFAPTGPAEASAETMLRTALGATHLRLVGQGVAQRVRCLPGVLDFGEVIRSAPKTLTIECENDTAGPVTLRIDGFEGDASFTLDGFGTGQEILLAAGAAARLPVTFAPSATARAEARLILSTDGDWKLPVVRLQGMGLDGRLHVQPEQPACIDFLPAPPGQASHAAILFENLTGAVRFATGAEVPPGFGLGRHLPLRLEADDPADPWWTGATWLPIAFTPTAPGPVEGTIRIYTDDPEASLVEICVRGFGGGPALVCDEEELDFGTVAVGEEAIATLRCENQGGPAGAEAARLDLFDVNATGTFFHASFTEPDARSIPTGGSFMVEVRLRTDRIGELYGAVLLMSSDPANPEHSVPVYATATE